MDVNVPRNIEVHEFRAEIRGFPDDLFRDDAVPQNILLVINVVEEKVQRRNPLNETALHFVPLVSRDDSRKQVEWENSLRPLVVVIDCEGDALA